MDYLVQLTWSKSTSLEEEETMNNGERVISVMGTMWTIQRRSEAEDKLLADCDGYTDWTLRRIVVEQEMQGNLGDMEAYIRKVTRHEIIHAFLFECGLAECAGEVKCWAQNEEMVDWFARVGKKICVAWEEAGVM